MVNDQRYQSILDTYFSQVAAATKEFENLLEENSALLKKLAAAQRDGEPGVESLGSDGTRQENTRREVTGEVGEAAYRPLSGSAHATRGGVPGAPQIYDEPLRS